jgi:MOSC domain-containing protein YiiM
MRVISLRVGRPTFHPIPVGSLDDEDTGGEPRVFRSAIAKHEVTGPVLLSTLGLTGDQVEDTRVHGGPEQALLAYAASHYPRWRAEWGRHDVGPGGFGENLTVEGADETTVSIGDRWAIGGALLEVTKPRSPCNRLAWYQGREDLIQRVRVTGRSGWYLRVLTPGMIEAGAEIRVVERRCLEMTVRRAALAMQHRTAHRDEAIALARCEALAQDWRIRLAKEGYRRNEAPSA